MSARGRCCAERAWIVAALALSAWCAPSHAMDSPAVGIANPKPRLEAPKHASRRGRSTALAQAGSRSRSPRAKSPAPANAAESETMAAWKKARSLADARQYDQALAVVREALQAHPDDVDLLWLEAGIYGESGRHHESVARYEKLVKDHPDLAPRVREDLATERLWADDPAGALRDFDLRIQEDPSDRDARRLRALALSHLDRLGESLAAYEKLVAEDPDDSEAELGRARVLAWMGRHAQSSAVYETYLKRHPDDLSARLALAQNVNWSGDHRRAAMMYQQMLNEGKTDPEITKGLAYAEYWEGRAEASRLALDRYLTERPEDPEGLSLARKLANDRSPSLTTGYERADDTDALRIGTTTVEYRHPLGDWTSLMARWRHDDAEDPGGERSPDQIAGGVQHRFSDLLTGAVWGGVLDHASGGKTLGVGEADLTLRPDDRWRIDAGWSREPVLTRLSLELGIMLNTFVAGFDWQASSRVTLHAAERLRYYSDDNRASLASASIHTAVQSSARLQLGLGAGIDYLTTDQNLDHGYYDPASYTEAGPTADATWHPRADVTIGVTGKIGQQHEQGAHAETFHSVSASVEVPLGSAASLVVEGGRSNSNLGSVSGYRRNRWAAYLTKRF
jgi:tetratricopeptide (TPR) repeat protein